MGIGVTGMSTTPLISSVISGGIFVMGLVVAGTLVDYRDAERAPTDVAASLYALLRETEAMNRIGQARHGSSTGAHDRGRHLAAC